MKVSEVIIQIQSILGVPIDQQYPRIGPVTRGLFEKLAIAEPKSEWGDQQDAAVDILLEAGAVISQRGIDFIKEFEGLYLTGYDDGGGVPTIGWGHTGLQHNDGTVWIGRKITKEKAEELLRYDLRQFEARVNRLVDVPLNQNQFDALVSFDFNTGGLKDSTLLKKLNALSYEAAANEFLRWDKDNGKTVPGLTRRRKSEKNLFEGKSNPIV